MDPGSEPKGRPAVYVLQSRDASPLLHLRVNTFGALSSQSPGNTQDTQSVSNAKKPDEITQAKPKHQTPEMRIGLAVGYHTNTPHQTLQSKRHTRLKSNASNQTHQIKNKTLKSNAKRLKPDVLGQTLQIKRFESNAATAHTDLAVSPRP